MKAKSLSKFKTVQTACGLGSGQFLFASSSDALQNTDYESTYVFRYDTISNDKTPWV
jgi:hypothetical protein